MLTPPSLVGACSCVIVACVKRLSEHLNRGVAALFAGLLLVALTPALAAQAAVTDVTIYDEANVLDDRAVASEIEALSSEQNVHIAVLASNDPALTENSYDENVKSLIESGDYADIAGTESQTLKDDVVLIAISPEVRKLGTYAGDGVRNADQIADSAVGEMKTPARDGDWDQAAVAGADASLQSINGESTAERNERVSEAVPASLPLVALLFAITTLVFLAVKIIPRIIKPISDHLHAKRLLAWEPSHGEIAASVRYWRAIEQRLGKAASVSPAQEAVASSVFNEHLLHSTQGLGSALTVMESKGKVPDGAKTSTKTRALIEKGFTGSPDVLWNQEVQPLLRRVEQGTEDGRLQQEIEKTEEARDDVRRFVKAYGDEVELSERARATVAASQEDLEGSLQQVRRDVQSQQISPWEAVEVVARKRKTFERAVADVLRRPVQNGMTPDRRRSIADQSIFHSNGLLASMLVYHAISSSSQDYHSSSSSSSYSNISTSISTSGFSGGSGSF